MSNPTNIEKCLKEKGRLTYTFKGTSMNPLLKEGRDLYTLIPKTTKRCKKYDVVLYKKKDKKYVLHRIIKVRNFDYVLQGDNSINKEYGIRDEDIVGIMTSFKRKEKVINVNDWKYCIYVRILTIVHPIINFFKRIKMKVLSKQKNTFAWIICAIGKVKRFLVALLIIHVLHGMAAIAKSLFLGQIVDSLVLNDKKSFIYTLIVFATIVICQIVLGITIRNLNELALSKTENTLKSRLFNAILNGDYGKIINTHSGEWMNRLTSDTLVVSKTLVNSIPESIGLFIRLIGALCIILWIEPKIMLFIFIGGIFLLLLTRIFRKITKKLHKDVQEADGRLRIFLQERLGSLLIIKSFVRENQTSVLAEKLLHEHKEARMKRNKLLNVFYSTYSVGVNAAYILGLIFCGFSILKGNMSYGNFVIIIQLLSQIQAPFANITGFIPIYYTMIASAERLREVEEIEEEKYDILDDGREFYENEFCALGLENATFTYQPFSEKEENVNAPITINNFCFEIKKCEHIAIIGPSGCGKSTVLKLLMNLYPLDAGEVYLLTKDGKVPLTHDRRNLFAYVPQGNQLFAGTIREAIAFGDKEKMKDEEGINRALHIACADGFVKQLKKGIDTMLGERGASLSEGQMQRIAIARAIFSEHPILLLDEATSALDESTATLMLSNIKSMTDKTVIMVTHRTGNIKTFSKVIAFSEENNNAKRI